MKPTIDKYKYMRSEGIRANGNGGTRPRRKLDDDVKF
jgi:hypothetical protein